MSKVGISSDTGKERKVDGVTSANMTGLRHTAISALKRISTAAGGPVSSKQGKNGKKSANHVAIDQYVRSVCSLLGSFTDF